MASERNNHAVADVCNFSDLSDCFSSDLSIIDKDINPVKRPRIVATVEDYDNPNESSSQQSSQSQQEQSSSMSLLEQLLAVVEPKRNEGRAFRIISRQLKNSLQRAENYAPAKLRDELLGIGEHVYGDTAKQRKSRIQKWMEDGSAEYAATIRRRVRGSQVGQFLQCITARNSRKFFQTDTNKQVTESAFVYTYFLDVSTC